MKRLRYALGGAFVALACAMSAWAAEPAVRLSDDGATILYRAEAGELPGTVAQRFGVAPSDVPAFLAANGIRDASRVAAGHVYRIPNPLAVQAAEAERRAATLAADAESARTRAAALEAQVGQLGARAESAERRAATLQWLARVWPWLRGIGIVVLLALGAALYAAHWSMTRLGAIERYAHELAGQVDERRRAALAERQAGARRILDLEARVHELETQLASHHGPRARPTGTH